ncbi:MAG: signal peptidase II [Clostridiales bacterium]|jgi:signal peptidase II|nr:signal peptidase II [Clostridiales bacterium]
MFLLLPVLMCAALITADQATKHLAVNFLKPLDTTPVIPGIMNFTYVENEGAAFGLMQGARWFFVVLTALVFGVIIYYYLKLPKEKKYRPARVAMVLVASGAIGNAIDRALNGFVVDFIHASFINFPVFNLADIYVVIGTILLSVMFLILGVNEEKTAKKVKEPSCQ